MSDNDSKKDGVEKYEPRAPRESIDSSAVLSTVSSSVTHAEENETEIFSGAAPQIVPSSISKFHHHVHSIKSPSVASISPLVSHGRESFILDEPYEAHQFNTEDETNELTPQKSQLSTSNFKFFSPDEIETAKGGSSIRRMTTSSRPDNIPIDYDTNWNSFEDDYANNDDDVAVESASGQTSTSSSANNRISDYGSVDAGSSDEAKYPERHQNYEAEDAIIKEQENEDKAHGKYNEVGVEYHDKFFLPKFPASNTSQRFYLAEEDLVIGIAGYRRSKVRLLVYYILIACTLGLFYVILRWFPRYKVQFLAKPTQLAKSDFVVIEDEFGLLDIIPVQRRWCNRKVSTFLPSPPHGDDPIIPVLISFEYRYMKFFYDPRTDLYCQNTNWVDERWCHYPDIKDGITEDVYRIRKEVFGSNIINIKEKTRPQLLRDEILHPFYAFQIFSIVLWLFDSYYYYAFCIFIISVLSISQSLVETRRNMRRMRKLSAFDCVVRARRNGYWTEISSKELVPGDIYEVSDPSLSIIPCDSVLLGGDCIVNESMLTGESVPVSKSSISVATVRVFKDEFSCAKFSTHFTKSFLYNGTKIVRCRYESNGEPATALVVRTGFNTTKGSLVRSMLFPKPTGFKFYEDSFKYIGVMGMVAAFGFIFSIMNFIKLHVDRKTVILRGLDIVTIEVPPALPATLTIGTSFALSRLRHKKIFCIAPTRLNIGGKLDVTCFDKTGTLTEEGLDVMGLNISKPLPDRKAHIFSQMVGNVSALPDNSQSRNLVRAMASCHSLKLIDGKLMGDPLDEKMFEFTGWKLVEDSSNDERLAKFMSTHKLANDSSAPILLYSNDDVLYQVKEYEFVSQLRRMSVICQDPKLPNSFTIFVKGAPEVMEEICLPETIPDDYHELLSQYTHSGYRVIACATRKLPIPKKYSSTNLRFLSDYSREKCEQKLEFLGFIIFENRLKDSTKGALEELRAAGLRTVMCTGDNILTAISVAKECSLVDKSTQVYIGMFNTEVLQNSPEDSNISPPPVIWVNADDPEKQLDPVTLVPLDIHEDGDYCIAITGDVFKFILTELSEMVNTINRMLMKGSVFARMSPDEKHELVDRLRALDYTVGFCGDGANDCGALKAADVGISLSEAEASVAAPFTSRVFEISCVPDVIKEGRASLVTSFSCFQYMSLYSAIQFISISILYKEGVNLGDFQFLYIDLFLIIPIAIFMSWSKAYPIICKKRPTANLISPKILIPLIGSMLIETIFQVWAWRLGKHPDEPWYKKAIPGNDQEVKCTDNTVVFLFANFQYIFAAIMLAVGPPYREPAIKNEPFVLTVIIMTLLSMALMIVNPNSGFGHLMDLTWVPRWICQYLLVMAVINYVILSFGYKYLFMKLARLYKRLFGTHKSKKKFKNLDREFANLSMA